MPDIDTIRTPTALITGGSSGIGFEMAKLLVEEGYDIILTANNSAKLNSAAEKLRTMVQAPHVDAVAADLSTMDGAENLYRVLKSMGRPVDLLFNNAGVGVYGDFARETDLRAEQAMIHVNIFSLVTLTKLVVQDMVARNSGKILFTSSIVGAMPSPKLAVYGATKAFVYSFAEGLRNELQDTDIIVTALLPGITDTGFFARAGMLDTKEVQKPMDNPADVAQAGYDALMANDDHVVVSLKNKMRVVMGKIMPASAAAAAGRVE